MKLYIIAGEPSGDLHGKNMLRALRGQLPDLEVRGVGGDGLAAEGMSLVRHIRDTNFMGFVQVLQNLGTIRQLFRDVKADILKFRPEAVVLIDYPGFNLRMARFCKEHGIKVFYYISPQVWAWKKGRVKQIRAYVDRMFVILPFEKAFYEGEGIDVDFVGHPLLDEIAEGGYDGESLRVRLLEPGQRLVALLPGSRKQEIGRMLPRMLAMVERFPDCQFVVAGAPTQDREFYDRYLQGSGVELVEGQTYELLSAADAALVTSGTATLETALFGVPEVVCYAGSPLSVWLARQLIKVKFISLVNLVMDREVVRELIQGELNTSNLQNELQKLLDPGHRSKLQQEYALLKEKLGSSGASEQLANLIREALQS